MLKKTLTLLILLLSTTTTLLSAEVEFSTAGFFPLEHSPRKCFSMNVAWRFLKGDVKNAQAVDFDDQNWAIVSAPHGIDLLPMNASGCHNYQGIVWYRKHFTPDETLKGKKLFLHFEGVMGKTKVFINGQLVKEHFGGYLPFSVDVSNLLHVGKDNVIAVCTDNSNDPDYPPGKIQTQLDYSYLGGLYRDVYLITHPKVYVTESTYENEIAGGGIFIHFSDVSEKSAKVHIQTEINNETNATIKTEIEYDLAHQIIKQPLFLPIGKTVINQTITVENPQLWSPEHPHLYDLIIKVGAFDSIRKRVGIRSFEFKGKKGGFYLNGKPYGRPIIGGNRHQDYAVIGNAVPNSLHYRDAKKMRDIGMKVVRNAHCPQDPAFLDACDELGLLVINNTPGWQFWNDKPIFGERVKSDIRQLVRRDRNHACMWFWEPVLNETYYPANAAKEWHDLVLEEYPFEGCYTASDFNARGSEHFPILYPHPVAKGTHVHQLNETLKDRTYFTREWGDCVDNWNSHNSPSRVHLAWGEIPQLKQAVHYANPDYQVTCLNSLNSLDTEYIGGTLWHTFDHQRGYHPDPFYGGLFDAFRTPKYSAYMFKSQQDPLEGGGNVFIAHEMTPFSPSDVTVFSNCDSVILTVYYDKNHVKTYTYVRHVGEKGIRYPLITFKNAYDFFKDKMSDEQKKVHMKAEGFLNGQCVASDEIKPARRPSKIRLYLDDEKLPLHADGSDIVKVVAELTDDEGNVKRLNEDYIQFTLQGEGRLLGGSNIMANPKKIQWGTAPIFIQATTTPGKIKVTASLRYEGQQKAHPVTLEFESKPAALQFIFNASELKEIDKENKSHQRQTQVKSDLELENERLLKELNALKLKEVEKQQQEFGEF